MTKHKYYLEINHDDMLTLTNSLSAALGIVIEDPKMFERAARVLSNKYDDDVNYRVTIAELLDKLNATHVAMNLNGECHGPHDSEDGSSVPR